jgi:hypothetical protein
MAGVGPYFSPVFSYSVQECNPSHDVVSDFFAFPKLKATVAFPDDKIHGVNLGSW